MAPQSAPAVLIVEDELVVASDLQQTLHSMGYDAYAIAASGDEALACASQRCPDVVLMDIRLKGETDGIETAEVLKNQYPVTVIFLTAYADAAIVDRAKRSATDGYLVKPVRDTELRSTIELALHRRELESAKERARAAERRLFAIADNIPIAIAYFDHQGKVQFANEVFRGLVPYRDNPIGVAAIRVMGEKLYREFYPSRQLAMQGDQTHSLVDLEYAGCVRCFEVTYLPDRDQDGSIKGVYCVAIDVTEREEMSAHLRQARVDLETILNSVPVSITSWHLNMTNRFANKAAEGQYGIVRHEALGRHLREVFGESRFRDAQPFLLRALAGERSTYDYVYDRNGELQFRHDEYVPEFHDSTVAGLYALSFDITEIRRSHEKVRLLAQRLESVREEERRAVAIVLHDGIAQDLFALKLGLDHLEGQVRQQERIDNLCLELRTAVANCMEDIRQIANDLRPTALANLRISAVLAQHAYRFGSHAKLDIEVTESTDFPLLDEATQLLFFRAAQEALTNVARHAQASHVSVRFSADVERMSMTIVDDGVGFKDSDVHKSRSLGLLGLRERFESRGGGLKLEHNHPKGTMLSVFLPTLTLGLKRPN